MHGPITVSLNMKSGHRIYAEYEPKGDYMSPDLVVKDLMCRCEVERFSKPPYTIFVDMGAVETACAVPDCVKETW